MPTPYNTQFMACDGSIWPSYDQCLEYERRWQLRQLGMSEEAVTETIAHASIFVAHAYLIRSILGWRGKYGMPYWRRRRPKDGEATGTLRTETHHD